MLKEEKMEKKKLMAKDEIKRFIKEMSSSVKNEQKHRTKMSKNIDQK
jgi:hypothetical protein